MPFLFSCGTQSDAALSVQALVPSVRLAWYRVWVGEQGGVLGWETLRSQGLDQLAL